ncbi:SH3 domain-containing protein [Falsiroseomonas oryzae]|uniref:SH3 domain-containing protein n=1 Tax=Falsiroseomonas oryzae TaxID=2766473 RepID=UPI0022EA5E65|nr:SH3 domain-containing protein [Roseomonas sp. MO-31]
MSDTSPYPALFRVAAATELREGPGPDNRVLRALPVDQVVALVGQPGQPWLEVEAPNGTRGFAPAGLLRRQVAGGKPPSQVAEMFPWRNVERANRDPKMLHPAFRNRALRTVARLNAEGIPFGIYEGMRGPWRQNHLFQSGRSRPGRILTPVQAWESLHQFGLAADFVLVLDGRWSWDDDEGHSHMWDRLEVVGADEGLVSRPGERPHLQLADVGLDDLRAGKLPPNTDPRWTAAFTWMVESWDGKPAAPKLK